MDSIKPGNQARISYWSKNYLPNTVIQIQEATTKNDPEWLIRYLLGLQKEIGDMLSYCTNTSKYDSYPDPKLTIERSAYSKVMYRTQFENCDYRKPWWKFWGRNSLTSVNEDTVIVTADEASKLTEEVLGSIRFNTQIVSEIDKAMVLVKHAALSGKRFVECQPFDHNRQSELRMEFIRQIRERKFKVDGSTPIDTISW